MKRFISILLIVMAANAFAHGENKFGPHNGYIRMPGAFHTELVPAENDSFSVYLMDVNNEQPTTKDSSLVFEYNNGESILFDCKVTKDHYSCSTDKKVDLGKGRITLNAVRQGKKGGDAVYELPLGLKVAKNVHSGHASK